jgi:hypothetical protein
MTEEHKEYSYQNGENHVMTEEKIEYIKNMRLDLVHEDMVLKNTGMLNLQYFNVKKGSYWSPHLTEKLKKLVCIYGAYHSKYCVYSVIKRHKFKEIDEVDPLKVKS